MTSCHDPILLLHGGPTICGYMHTLEPFLQPHPVFTFAQPGTKESPSPRADLQTHFSAIQTEMRRIGAGKVILLGHSWGANLALLFASAFPSCVTAVVVIGTAPLSEALEHAMGERVSRRLGTRSLRELQLIDQEVERALREDQPALVEALVEKRMGLVLPSYVVDAETLSHLPETSFSLLGFRQSKDSLWERISAGQIPALLRAIPHPVFAVHGREDVMCCDATLAFLRAHVSRFQGHPIHGVGHFPWLEPRGRRPFGGAMRAILREVSR